MDACLLTSYLNKIILFIDYFVTMPALLLIIIIFKQRYVSGLDFDQWSFLTQIKISCVSKLQGTKNNGNTSLSNRKKNKSDPFQILFSDRVKQNTCCICMIY